MLEERRQQQIYFIPSMSNQRPSGDVGDGYRQMFTTELLSILTEKLEAFWKLAQGYLSESTDDRFHEKREDVDVSVLVLLKCIENFKKFDALFTKNSF